MMSPFVSKTTPLALIKPFVSAPFTTAPVGKTTPKKLPFKSVAVVFASSENPISSRLLFIIELL